jgi:hypothetical protein
VNEIIKNPIEIVNAFNEYFINTIINLNINNSDIGKALKLLKNCNFDNIVSMETIPVTGAEVISIIQSLKPKNATGYDGILNKILKLCAHSISKPLTYIFNCSLGSGIFPERCKSTIVRPIHKKGGKDEMNDYRPISLLITIPKILETVMYNRLAQHSEVNNIITSAQ